ncbi:MAG TPA: choice-of-anchor P family protein [Vicinamibacterales bacterium]|nr:choice-of-anchor P family protein [Vicinamibacterales bacterium]
MTHCNIRAVLTCATLLPCLLIAGASTAAADHGGTSSSKGVQPVVIVDNPSCADVAPGTIELKIQPVVAGTHSDGTLEFAILSVFDNRFFDWASNIGVDAIIVKGGPNANVYSYAGEATRDGSLHAPINHQNNKPYGLSHVSVCYDQDAAPPPPPDPTQTSRCTGQAYDIRLDLAGTVASGFLGPAVKTHADVFPDKEQLSSISLSVPGASGPLVTADTLIAENSGTPDTGCTTHVSYENLTINMNNVPGRGVPLTISAAVLRTTAVARSGAAPSTDVQIVGLQVNGVTVNVSPAPNTVLLDLSTLGVPDLTGSIVLHERRAIPGGLAANGIRIQAFFFNLLTGIDQAIDLKVAHAEADVHEIR